MSHSRRTFIRTAVIAGAATVFDIRKLAAASYVRLDVGPLTASSPALASYAKAIKAMQALPSTNPLSWAYQAAIHGTTLSGSQPAWNTCQHGTPMFWSWHRMYLYWFERIVRKMSGDSTFALPYWNYELDTERQLPVPFRDSASALYTANRGSGWNTGAAALSASAVDTSGFMPIVPYFNAQSSCEGTPHASVHVSIGGWMGSVPTAGQDPIFYLHHANIDRLWNLWLKQGGMRSDPLIDAAWRTTKFLFFDENGAQVWMTGCDILRAEEQLNYTYENEGTQVKEYCLRPLPRWIYETKSWPIRFPPIKLPPGPDPPPYRIDVRPLRDQLLSTLRDGGAEIALEFLRIEADKQPNVFWEVYVGLPPGAAASSDSPHFVGTMALFGHGIHDAHQHGGFKPAAFSFRCTRAVQTALTRDASGTLAIALVARGAAVKDQPTAPRNEAAVTVGASQLVTRRAKAA
jgi:hypothetical protein